MVILCTLQNVIQMLCGQREGVKVRMYVGEGDNGTEGLGMRTLRTHETTAMGHEKLINGLVLGRGLGQTSAERMTLIDKPIHKTAA